MNFNHFCVFDFETNSKNPYTTQPLQLAAVIVDARKLKIIEGATFKSLIKPVEDSLAPEIGLDVTQDDALAVNHLTREEVAKAPPLKVVWEKFVDFVNNYNTKKTKWTAPIPVGHNVDFDLTILHRIAAETPYNFGPKEDDRPKCSIFHPIHKIDTMSYLFKWMENDTNIRSFSMDNMREHMGITKTGSHDALGDVLVTALMLIKFLKLTRKMAERVQFKDSFLEENKIIESIMNEQSH